MNKQNSGSDRQNESGQLRSNRSGDSRTEKSNNNGVMQSSQLMKLFEAELKDIYWVEKTLTKAIPKMIKNATSPELVDALENHLSQTKQQVGRVEQVFEVIGKKATTKTCLAMEGILDEAEEIMDECEEGAMCDAGIISAAQKVEHYEIASTISYIKFHYSQIYLVHYNVNIFPSLILPSKNLKLIQHPD